MQMNFIGKIRFKYLLRRDRAGANYLFLKRSHREKIFLHDVQRSSLILDHEMCDSHAKTAIKQSTVLFKYIRISMISKNIYKDDAEKECRVRLILDIDIDCMH
jgi:hypothetical protein